MIKEAMLDVIGSDTIINVIFGIEEGSVDIEEREKSNNWKVISNDDELTITKVSVPTRRTVKLYTKEDLREKGIILLRYKDDDILVDTFI